MEQNPLLTFNLRDVYRVIFRHKWRSLGVLIASMCLVVLAVIFVPRKYASEAQLLVNVGVESLTSDPTTNKTPSVSLQVARAEEIKTLLDLFRSKAIADDVVEDLGLDLLLHRNAKPSMLANLKASLKNSLSSVMNLTQVSDHENAVVKIRKMVKVTAEPKSNVIVVIATADSPELAQKVASSYVELAKKKHSMAHETENSTEFLRAKLNAVKKQLLVAGNNLRDARNEIGVVSIEARKRTLEEQMRQVQLSILNARSDKNTFTEKIEKLHAEYDDLPAATMTASTSSVSSKALDAMRSQLYTLRVQTQGLASRYKPNHPRHRGAMKQVEKAEFDMAAEELRFAVSNVATLESKLDSYRNELAAKRGELQQLNLDDVKLKALQSEVDLLDKRYESYNADVAKSQIIEDRRQQQITNINVFQPATQVDTPVSPNRKLLFAVGAAAAIFGAIGIALLSEFLDGSLKTTEEVESRLGLPVLASLPYSRQRMIIN